MSWLDYDNDGLLDLYAVNGAVETIGTLRGTPYPYRMKNRLLHNDGGVRFVDVSDGAGPALQLEAVGRGLAVGDLNNDGRLDMIASNNNGTPWLLVNETRNVNHWLLVRLEGTTTNRMGLGAEVGVVRKGQTTVWRRARTDGSYVSASDARVHFGLGVGGAIESVVVRWNGGDDLPGFFGPIIPGAQRSGGSFLNSRSGS